MLSMLIVQAYHLLRRRTGRGQPIWQFNCNTIDIIKSFLQVWAVDDKYVSQKEK